MDVSTGEEGEGGDDEDGEEVSLLLVKAPKDLYKFPILLMSKLGRDFLLREGFRGLPEEATA